jgi:hypothetical protein
LRGVARAARAVEVLRERRGDDHRVGQRERQLRQHRAAEGMLEVAVIRQHEGRPGWRPGELRPGRADAGRMRQEDRGAERDQSRRAARDAQQQQQQPGGRETEPRQPGHQLEAEQRERDAEPELEARDHRLRHQPCEARDRPGQREQQEDQPEAEAGCGDLAGGKTARDQHRRDRLHGLDRDRQPVEQAARDEERAEAEQHADRGETRHRDRAQGMRQEGAEIAERAADLAGDPSGARLRGNRPGVRVVAAGAGHGLNLMDFPGGVQRGSSSRDVAERRRMMRLTLECRLSGQYAPICLICGSRSGR